MYSSKRHIQVVILDTVALLARIFGALSVAVAVRLRKISQGVDSAPR
jgi:hypothetical protein